MSKKWLEQLESHLPHFTSWHPISTAPYNQELELRITDNGQIVTLQFPCLRTNEEAWINVDLGTQIRIEPVEWRAWHHKKSAEAHHAKIRPADRSTVTHPDHGRNTKRVSGKS
jgi:hypothetical protein